MHRRALIAPLLLLALFSAAHVRAAAGVNEFEGLIEPFEIVNVGSPVEGVVHEVLVERSGLVRRGDPLVRLESSVEEAALKRARATAAVEGEIRTEEGHGTFVGREPRPAVNRALSAWKELTAPRPVQRTGVPATGV